MHSLTTDEKAILADGHRHIRTGITLDEFLDNKHLFTREFSTQHAYGEQPYAKWGTGFKKTYDIEMMHPCDAYRLFITFQRYTGVKKIRDAYETTGYDCRRFAEFCLTFVSIIHKEHKAGAYLWEMATKVYADNGFSTDVLTDYLESMKTLDPKKIIKGIKNEIKETIKTIREGKYNDHKKGIADGIHTVLFGNKNIPPIAFGNSVKAMDTMKIYNSKLKDLL